MRAYNTNLGILLPLVRVDWVGLNLEDFMRRVLLAVKSAHQDNLYYPPYPIVRHTDNPDMATSHAEEVIRLAEYQLARYIVLPQEKAMILAYRKMMRDVGMDEYPAKMQKADFYGYYLAPIGFPALELAFDALFWYLAGRTSRNLTAEEGITLVTDFFQDPATQLAPDRAELVRERYSKLVPQDLTTVEAVKALAESPFPKGKFIIVGSESAPVEGTNSVFVEFSEEPVGARLSCRMHKLTYERLGDPKLAQSQIETVMIKLAEERLGAIITKPTKGEADAA